MQELQLKLSYTVAEVDRTKENCRHVQSAS